MLKETENDGAYYVVKRWQDLNIRSALAIILIAAACVGFYVKNKMQAVPYSKGNTVKIKCNNLKGTVISDDGINIEIRYVDRAGVIRFITLEGDDVK